MIKINNVNMTKERSATATIKGYYYQFDYFILQLLKCNSDTDSICIEGIEDVDLNTVDETTAIQCKYYAGTEYNHSVISQPLRYMIDHYLSSASRELKYKIYGYYKSGQEKLITPLDKDFFKNNFLKLKAFSNLLLTDENIDGFLSHLEINIYAKEFGQQETDIFNILQERFKCNGFEAEFFYYNNSLRVVKELSTTADVSKRCITKGNFIGKINKKHILFNQWFMAKKGVKAYCASIKKEFFSHSNLSPFERFFIIECDIHISDIEIKSLLITIGDKYSRISIRESGPFCPYIYLYGLADSRLKSILKKLHCDNFSFIDGYDYKNAEFSVKSICRKATYHNGVKLKILYDIDTLNSVINNISTTREIYQFYTKNPVYDNINHRHAIIFIEQTIHINQII